MVFADESGFLLIPHVAKTWAPGGQTPVIHHRYRRDKISVISGVSVSPKRQRLGFFHQLYFQNIGQEEVCEFLRRLLRHLRVQVNLIKRRLDDSIRVETRSAIERKRWRHVMMTYDGSRLAAGVRS